MMLRRRCPKPTCPRSCAQTPTSSGPRWAIRSLIASRRAARSGIGSPRRFMAPQMPHMSRSRYNARPGARLRRLTFRRVGRPARTAATFRDKWARNPDLAFRQTLDECSEIFRWIVERNGFDGAAGLTAFLAPKRRILDAGCGNGRVTALLRRHADPEAEIVAIDLTAADVARANLEGAERVSVLQRDLLDDLTDLGEFDFVYCQEVLHHTADPERAFRNLAERLAPEGEIAIYVYRRKAPV